MADQQVTQVYGRFDVAHSVPRRSLRAGQASLLALACLGLFGCATAEYSRTTTPGVQPKQRALSAQQTDTTRGSRRYVIEDRVAERLAPDAATTATNHIYKGQAVQVYETEDGWARVSPFYDGQVEGMTGQVARWVRSSSLSVERPAAPSELVIASDPRVVELTRRAGHGLNEQDVLILHAAAHHFLESGVATKVVDGDKSVSRAGYYYLNFDKPQNHFFRPSDIPDLDIRIAALRR